ncbi:biotin/lipoyl-binding protein [Porphyromonas sp.]|uniref:biotin/lipoyl-binding protein n=1 Tax=Porphyromonas sp. TaxID=1924944 RepID=UPI0026DA6EA6|nr:biotin/lipoyl-binding protein [Porphyromonas sp.]MDO4770397.1 biotin/lipoyl-binding protein [Porphyromonas sp.]
MKKKSIKFSLIYRDMFQSSGKYQPRADQLARIAPLIVEMGCFSRVETNGGAFEQVNLLYGENPNKAVRTFTKPLKDAGIQTHMLDRGLNGLRMYPVPADVRRLMYKVKKAQGVDITRIFCGLNDVRNIIPSIKYAKEAGMIPQATLCITHSPIHTVEYYFNIASQLIEAGAPEICLKDMAGIGRPATLGKIVKAIKDKYPDVIIEYHGHTGPGFSVASMLEVCRNGADIVDVAIEPLAWGKIHPDVITIQAMLKDAGFDVPEINMNAYMKARALTQEFIDDFLGYFMDDNNLKMSSLLVGCGLPGGMMGSMMADLKGVHAGINMHHRSNGTPELSIDDLLVKLFQEVEYVWPKLGYPPLVTPFSQYVKNVALMNVYNMERGEGRWQAIDPNTWDMILGKAGRLPGPLAPEIVELAKEKGYEFTDADPQSNFPDKLDEYREEMKREGWELGEDDEELFELAMHDRQYRDYKSGVAKERFYNDLNKLKDAKMAEQGLNPEDIKAVKRAKYVAVTAPASGQVFWDVDMDDRSAMPMEGTSFRAGSKICFIMTPMAYTESVYTYISGRIREVVVQQGGTVRKGDVIAYLDEVEDFLPEETPKTDKVKRVENTPYVSKPRANKK